jgi:hypothetical protein
MSNGKGKKRDCKASNVTRPKRRVAGLVVKAGMDDPKRCSSVEKAASEVGLRLEGHLDAMIDASCTCLFVDLASFPPEDDEVRVAQAFAGILMLETSDTRDPVLTINAGSVLILVCAPAGKIEGFFETQRRQRLPLLPPPENPLERWVASILHDQTACRTAIGLGPAPGVARA